MRMAGLRGAHGELSRVGPPRDDLRVQVLAQMPGFLRSNLSRGRAEPCLESGGVPDTEDVFVNGAVGTACLKVAVDFEAASDESLPVSTRSCDKEAAGRQTHL